MRFTTLILIVLLVLPFAAARTFSISDDGTVIDADRQPSKPMVIVGSTDDLATLVALRQRSTERVQYDGGEVYDVIQQQQDDLMEQYLLNRAQQDSPDWDWRHPIDSLTDYWDYRRNPYDSRGYDGGYSNSYGRYGDYYPGYTATDYYYQQRTVYPYSGYDSRNSYYDPYHPYHDPYSSGSPYWYNDTYRPYDWYYLQNGEYRECNGDDFRQYDCTYRWNGREHYRELGYDDWLYYDKLYHLDDVDLSDRFTITDGRYILCPRNGYNQSQCGYYFKGGGFYYDNPLDNPV